MYDAIIVGARCAGSPTAMLLARRGYRVLLVDRADFPSDTVSTHGIQTGGIARLHEWGLLDTIIARGTPPTGITTIHVGDQMIQPPADPSVAGGQRFSPRRYVLDQVLLEAAVAAGADVRTGFTVDDLLFDGDRVTGVRGHARGSTPVEERARIVVGADGKHSFVAKRVGARAYHDRPAKTLAFYTYFSDAGLTDTDLYVGDECAVFGWPTNDGLSLVGVMRPAADFSRFRADGEKNLLRDIATAPPSFSDRVLGGRRAERIVGSVDLPNFFREAYGPGWVLAGDAGYTKDPVTALGITDAFRAAEQVAHAIDEGFSGTRPLDEALADYQRIRDQKAMPLYQFTLDLASFRNARTQQDLIESRIPAGTRA